METSEISHRVADFLKRHPPFSTIDEPDLLALAATGRVRFHEPHDYVLSQGEPHRHQVFVIQQGTVSLWDESGGRGSLRDVRGAGDMLGVERFNGAGRSLYTARSETDVVIYAFPAEDFAVLVLSNPTAAQYIRADARVAPDDGGPVAGREPHRTALSAIVRHDMVSTCRASDTVADAASRLLAVGSGAIGVLTDDGRMAGVLTAEDLVGWSAAGGGAANEQSVGDLVNAGIPVLAPDASVSDAILALCGTGVGAVAMTADGTASGTLQAVVTTADLSRFFGDQPSDLLSEIRRSRPQAELRELNRRVRAFTLHSLTGAQSVEWLSSFTREADDAIVSRLLAALSSEVGCWCVCGPCGRGESLTSLDPGLLVLVNDAADIEVARSQYRLVVDGLAACGYLPSTPTFDDAFRVAYVREWKERYRAWIGEPIVQQMYRARALFDIRPVYGTLDLFDELLTAVAGAVDRDFLHVLANDCLANVPPLTFYEDAVVDTAGERFATFQLEESALRPLVDVARVFGMAGGAMFGRSTLERFAVASALVPEEAQIFAEATEIFRVVLWQQGKIGIGQGTSGAELAPALLSSRDRKILRNGFRSILHLLQFTANPEWLLKV